MLSPFAGFEGREIFGAFTVANPTQSGLAVAISSTINASAPLNPNPYGNFYGTLVPASVTTSGLYKEQGWLLQPVSQTGPSILSILASIYDESVAVGQTAAVVLPVGGKLIATDQYLPSGTGAIVFDGSVTLGTTCGIANGQPRVLQSGDVPRLVFLGKVVQRTVPCAIFQIV